MKREEMTKEQLMEELEAMRRHREEVKNCKKEFESTQSRYQKLLDAAPDPMIFTNPDYEIIFVNSQAEDLFGYTQQEMVCKHLDMLIPARYRRVHKGYVKEFFSNPRRRLMGAGLKIFAIRKDGTEFRADISLSPMRLNGDLITVAAIRDITERVREQELIEKNYFVQKVVDSILKMSLENIPLVQKMAGALDLVLSFPYMSLGRKGAVYLVSGDNRDLVLAVERGLDEGQREACRRIPLGKCLCGKAAAECALLFTDCPGEDHEPQFAGFPHGHYCVPIVAGGEKPRPLGLINVYVREGHKRDPDEEAFLTAVADIFAGMIVREMAEREKDRLQANLAQAEKLAALGRVAANVSHAIRNPLTSVGGFAKRLQKMLPDGTSGKEYAGLIASEVSTLESILRNVLSFSRAAPPKLEGHDIRGVIDSILALHEDALRRHSITLEKSYSRVPEVRIDREQAQEAIENIIVNAIDAMPSGGKLSVELAITAIGGKPHVTVRIKDTGQGMDEELLEKIFEPFFSTKAVKGGAGLGLPISKKIMEDHGGSISVESKPGQGTAFSLNFPLRTPA